MGCKKKYKRHSYSGFDMNSYGSGNDVSMKDMAKAGNKAIDGLMFKCVAVKKPGCR